MPVATAVVSSLLAAASVSTAAVTTVTSTTVTSITRSFGLLHITTIAFGAEGEVRILAFGAGPIATAVVSSLLAAASVSTAAVASVSPTVATLTATIFSTVTAVTTVTSTTVTSITRSFGLLRITTIAFGAEGEVRILAFGAGPIATAIASISAAAVVSTLIALATTLMSSAAITTSATITSSTIVPLIATAISTVTTLVTTSAVLARCDFDRRADSARRIDLGIQRMNVNQRSVDRSYDRVHTAQRFSANHANHSAEARCTPLERNQKPTFVRLLLDVAGETHVFNPRRPEYMRATDAARSSPGSPIAGSENPGLPFTVGSGSTGSGSSKR